MLPVIYHNIDSRPSRFTNYISRQNPTTFFDFVLLINPSHLIGLVKSFVPPALGLSVVLVSLVGGSHLA